MLWLVGAAFFPYRTTDCRLTSYSRARERFGRKPYNQFDPIQVGQDVSMAPLPAEGDVGVKGTDASTA